MHDVQFYESNSSTVFLQFIAVSTYILEIVEEIFELIFSKLKYMVCNGTYYLVNSRYFFVTIIIIWLALQEAPDQNASR